jgi:Holliday junction resolvase RusA-like endonuclease
MGTALHELSPRLRALVEKADAQQRSEPIVSSHGTFRVVKIEPMGKPRMTQRDKWAKRPVVMRYRDYADQLRAGCTGITSNPVCVSWRAFFTMPKSWSKKKREAHLGALHRAKPDRDNIDKGILDALWEQDSGIARGTLEKRWDEGNGARLEITAE